TRPESWFQCRSSSSGPGDEVRRARTPGKVPVVVEIPEAPAPAEGAVECVPPRQVAHVAAFPGRSNATVPCRPPGQLQERFRQVDAGDRVPARGELDGVPPRPARDIEDLRLAAA